VAAIEPGQAEGPSVQIAAFCERVLQEGDGVLSLIRVVDRLTAATQDPGAPETMPPFPVNLTLVLALKSGFLRGRHDVQLRSFTPSQQPMGDFSIPALFEGEDRGVNLLLPIAFQAPEEGLYWFEVRFGGRVLTRVPLRLIYQRFSGGRVPPLSSS
jgi:hypothetical protein